MCRNDKKLLKYQLDLELYDAVMPEPDSYIQPSSVGRVFLNLTKTESPSRWKRLLSESSIRPPNMGTWWSVYEQHEKDLNKFAPEDDDDYDSS